jgi:hypothetical protein
MGRHVPRVQRLCLILCPPQDQKPSQLAALEREGKSLIVGRRINTIANHQIIAGGRKAERRNCSIEVYNLHTGRVEIERKGSDEDEFQARLIAANQQTEGLNS